MDKNRFPTRFCKMEKKVTYHMDLGEGMNPRVRWKCMDCGEYNRLGEDMIPEIQEILERVFAMGRYTKDAAIPSPDWADEEYVEHCGELTEREKRHAYLSDAAEEITRLIYKARGE